MAGFLCLAMTKRGNRVGPRARHAGIREATSTVVSTIVAAPANEVASVGLTPYRRPVSSRVMATEPTSPQMAPTTPSRRPRPRNLRSSSARLAPIAIRMPISCVLCFAA